MNLNKNIFYRTILFGLLVFIMLQSCKTKKLPSTIAKTNKIETISYQKDLLPIMLKSCTPCHFPQEGKKKMLDTFTATKENIYDIIRRVELAPDHKDFMPFRSKRPQLTQEEIKKFKDWVNQDFSE